MESFRSRRPYTVTWDLEFSKPSPPRHAAGVQPMVTPEACADTQTSDETIDAFMNYGCDDDPNRYIHRKQTLQRFINSVDTAHLEDAKDSLFPCALMVDQETSTESEDAHSKLSSLPLTSAVTLTANQLYSKLQERRLESFSDDTKTHRRLIYVTDLDPKSVVALAATASREQVPSLRSFIYRHLHFRSLIRGEISFPSSRSFSLEFHLPFYAWRASSTTETNSRPIDNGRPRRSYEAVPDPDFFQNGNCNPDLQGYIHEAAVSVVVTGINDRSWIAYAFVDTYFKGELSAETIENYHGKQLDAFYAGTCSIQSPVWNPREYYLQVLEARMAQVTQEYSNTTFRLIQLSEPYSSVFAKGGLGSVHLVDSTQSSGFTWLIRMLRQTSHLLSKTINSWDAFNNGDVGLFYRPNSDDLVERSWVVYLAKIDRHVTELRDMRSSLLYHTELLENMSNSLVNHARIAESRATESQSAFIRVLTIITAMYLPVSLATTIFSMQLPIITEDSTLKHFTYTLFGLICFTLILVLATRPLAKFGLFIQQHIATNNPKPTSEERNRTWRKMDGLVQRVEANWVDRFGAAIVDTYFEQIPGSIQALLNDLPFHVRQPPVRRGLARLFSAFCDSISCKLSAVVPWRERASSGNLSNPSGVENHDRANTTDPSSSAPVVRSILRCISRLRSNYHKTVMLPVDLTLIKDDEALFRALKAAYRRKIGRFQLWLCMRTIVSIRFVHFEVDKESLVDIKYSSCDDKKVLEAFPPEDHPDYLYLPKPIGLVPPIGHNLLLTMYHAPKNGTGRKGCMSRIPKYRLDKIPLRVDDGLGNAWGLELVEGRRWEAFWYIAALVFLCSTAIALGYGLAKKDVSAGFTIAGFLETSFGVGIAIATISATADYFS